MNINDEFPSKYIKATDLKGRDVTVVIADVVKEEIGRDKERKHVIYFQGKDKGMVCNKTNLFAIGALYGPETEDWVGKEITLFGAKVMFGKDIVDGLRVKAPARFNGKSVTPRQPSRPTASEEMEDEVPF